VRLLSCGMWYSAATQSSYNLELCVKFGLGNTDFAPNNKIVKGTCIRVQYCGVRNCATGLTFNSPSL